MPYMARLNSIGIVGAPPYCSSFTSERIGNSHQSYQFGTFTLPHFTSLHKLWYKQVDGKNIQVLPDNVAYLLTPIAIGYWLASDGSYSQRDAVVTIYTDSFSPDEVGLLRGILLERYGILSTRYSNGHAKEQFVTRIRKASMSELQRLVALRQ